MSVGERVKSIRTERGMTVAALADLTGLSKGLISQVENNKTSPSIATLEKIAEGLKVPAAYLLLKACEAIQVVRSGERMVYRFGPDGLKVEILSGHSPHSLKAVLVEFPPGTTTGCDAHAHGGEEFHLILEGEILAEQGDRSVVLKTGDAFHWKGCIPHRIKNVGETTARVLAVTSASMGEVLGQETEI